MYEYTYETVYTGGGFWLDNSSQEHREIIASMPPGAGGLWALYPAGLPETAASRSWTLCLRGRQ